MCTYAIKTFNIECKYKSKKYFMSKKVTTSIILYKSQTKKNGKHPAKLRVTYNRKQMYYSIDSKNRAYEFTPKEFEKVLSPKPRGVYKAISLEFSLIESKANNIIVTMSEFSFRKFKTHFGITGGDMSNILYFYKKRIKELIDNNQFSSHRHYISSSKMLKKYFGNSNRIDFREITSNQLDKYERWLIDRGLSLSTVRCYTVATRAIFRTAQSEGAIPLDIYPFGPNGYQIPIGRNIKKALKINEIEKIYNYVADEFSKKDEARDMWLFSYFMNGANIADISRLRYRNIDGDFITFIRKKTEKTSKRLKPISVPVTNEITRIINKWGNKDKSPDNYVFNILNDNMNEKMKYDKNLSYIQMLNKNMKEIGKELDIEKPITTYTARHSFSTVLKRSGVSTEFIGESLGHNDFRTTELYLDSFEDDMKKEFANHLTSFKNKESA